MHNLQNNASNSVTRGIIYLTVGQIVFVCSGAVLNIALARFFFTPVQMGIFGTVISILVWMEVAISSGLAIVIKRSISRNVSTVKKLYRLGCVKQLRFALTGFILVFILIPVTGRLFSDKLLAKLLAFASLDMFLFGLYRLTTSLLNGLYLFKQQSIAIAAYAVGKLISIIVIVALVSSDYVVVGALTGNMIASLIGFAFAYGFYRGQDLQTDTQSNDRLNNHDLSGIFSTSIWTLAFILNSSVGIWITEAVRGSEDAGFYVVADTAAKAVLMAAFGIRCMVIPQFSRHFAQGDRNQARSAFFKTIICCLIFGLLPALFLSLLAEPLVRLVFSNRYLGSIALLRVLSLGYFFVVVYEMFSHMLIACDKQQQATKIVLLFALINIPVMICAAYRYGTIGVAWVFLGSFAVGAVLIFSRFGLWHFAICTQRD